MPGFKHHNAVRRGEDTAPYLSLRH